MMNQIPIYSCVNDSGTFVVQTAQADAAMMQQAYWLAKAHSENFYIPPSPLNHGERGGR